MLNLYKTVVSQENSQPTLSEGEKLSVFYHDLFDFPLNLQELIRWRLAEDFSNTELATQVLHRNGYFFIEGKEGVVYKRTLRKRISDKKIEIAKKASKVLSLVPGVLMVAVTGSLAMDNAADESDIDLMIVTKSGRLWTTRLLSYSLTKIFGIETRRSGDKDQKDKLCMNIWLDESDLKWTKNRNIYTAHEIAQIKPILSKENTYERFLFENRWILRYWPNSVKVKRIAISDKRLEKSLFANGYLLITWFVEKLAFWIQLEHMKSRITREVVTPTRALFHPQDWSGVVLSRFSS